MDNLKRFISVTKKFIETIDNFDNYTVEEFLKECHSLISTIYYLGFLLPQKDLNNEEELIKLTECSVEDHLELRKKLSKFLEKHDNYWEIFDPIYDTEPVQASISDALTDIYFELRNPLQNFNDKQEDAIWEWRFGLRGHCGNHILSVLKPIHKLIFDHL